MPLLLGEGEGKRLDFCPENFPGRTSFPAAAILDLERINAALAGINLLYAAEVLGPQAPAEERQSIADYLRDDL
ncbi:MAG: hypothetical protein IH612_18635 [Desulfofustis sp.]|nr:hypothetical protein [Desulfofustis sp.]